MFAFVDVKIANFVNISKKECIHNWVIDLKNWKRHVCYYSK